MFENPRRGRQARNFTTNVPKILDLKSFSEQIFSENWRWVPLKLVLTMLTISFVSECRLWKACLTTVWHSFQANRCSKKSSAKLFWVYWSKSRTGCCRSTTTFGEILIYHLFAAVKLKQREKNVVLVASPLRMLSMIKLKQWILKPFYIKI